MDRSSVKMKSSPALPNFDGTHDLKLGKSFKKDRPTEFHTIRYDFKPASIDHSKEAQLEILDGKEVNITFPNVENKGTTVFRGMKKPSQKECVLIFDHRTKEFTLERLSVNIQVKKQRHEGSSKIQQQAAKASATQLNKKGSHSSHSNQSSALALSPVKVREQDTVSPQPPSEPSPSPVSDSAKPPTPDLPATSRKLSLESSVSSPNYMSDSSSASSSSSSSGSDSSSDEDEPKEPVVKAKPKSPPPSKKMKTSQPPVESKMKKAKQSLPSPAVASPKHIMSQLSADLQLSESDSD